MRRVSQYAIADLVGMSTDGLIYYPRVTAILQKVLGHESIKTTQIYSDTDEDAVHRAYHQYSPVDDEIDSNNGSL